MRKYLIPLCLALIFFIIGLFTLSDYGINWDAPVHMMRGQGLLHFFLTGKGSFGEKNNRLSPILIKPGEFVTRYDFMAEEQPPLPGIPVQADLPNRPRPQEEWHNLSTTASFYQSNDWNGKFWVEHDDGHPPLADIFSALTNKIFSEFLRILGDIQGYQIFYLFISAIGVFVVSAFALDISGSRFAALIAGLSLGLFPLFLRRVISIQRILYKPLYLQVPFGLFGIMF